MKTLTIHGKQSNTGTIHDLAYQDMDRVIKFRGATRYAVILAGYYGGKGYTTHKTSTAAAAAAKRVSDYSHMIIDDHGKKYDAYGGDLWALDEELRESYAVAIEA